MKRSQFVLFFIAALMVVGVISRVDLCAADEKNKEFKGSQIENLLTWPAESVLGTGQAIGQTVFNLGTIRVAASRLRTERSQESPMNLPASIAVVDQQRLESSASGSLPEILSQGEGVTYSDDLGQGLNARVDLRGFGGEAKQALVLFDGLRAVEPFDNSMAWHLYPSEYMRQAEIERGGDSTIYGEGALSGVIRMETKEPTQDWHVATQNSFGSFHEERNFLEASGTASNIGLYVGARYLSSQGYRQNSDHESASTLLKTTALLGEFFHLKNSFFYIRNDTGIPGPLSAQEVAQNRRQKDPEGQFGDKFEDELVQDGLMVTYFAEPVGIEISDLLGYRSRRQDSVQSFGGSFPGTSLNNIGTETFSNVLQGAGSLNGENYESASVVGIEWSIDDIHNPFTFDDRTFGPFSSERSIDRRFLGYFAQNKFTLWQRWILETGARYDDINWNIYDLKQPELQKRKVADHWSPKAALEFKIADALSLFAGVSESFKAPDSNALIFETPNIFSPNPNVDSSVARHREIGLRYAHPSFGSLRASYFNIATKKEILFNDISNTNENFDTRRQGLELGGEWFLCRALELFAHYTYTRAQFDNGIFDGKDIPLVPKSVASAGVVWKPDTHWNVGVQANATADQFALNDFNNRFSMENYWTLDARIGYRRKNYELFLKAQNILGESYSSFVTSNGVDTVNFNPAPKETWQAGVRVEI